jgi:hypothetical protein
MGLVVLNIAVLCCPASDGGVDTNSMPALRQSVRLSLLAYVPIRGLPTVPFDPIKLEPINANPGRLARIFSDEFAFAVPTYQRPYAWERDQAGALLDDVLAAVQEARAEKEPVTYFLGSIVLIKQSGSPDAMVVDGQQRLTTLTILLSVLRDLSADQPARRRHRRREGNPDRTVSVHREAGRW